MSLLLGWKELCCVSSYEWFYAICEDLFNHDIEYRYDSRRQSTSVHYRGITSRFFGRPSDRQVEKTIYYVYVKKEDLEKAKKATGRLT